MRVRMVCVAVVVAVISPLSVGQTPVGTGFTYQGRLVENGVPADGQYAFNFSLCDASEGGNQIGATVSLNRVRVTNGLFTVTLDFGSAFLGDAYWLEVEVGPQGSGTYTMLSPRQRVTPTPYASHCVTAESVPDGVTGSGTLNRVARYIAPNTIGDSVIYEDGMNVGINNTSPTQTLDVGNVGKAYNHLRLGAGAYTGIMFYDGEGSYSGQIYYNHVDDYMRFSTRSGANAYERMRITSDGDVGVGTSVPEARLDVAGTFKTGGFRLGSAAVAGQVLTADGDGVGTWQDVTVPDSSITTDKLADNAVNSAKVASGAIGSNEIMDGTISSIDLAPASVTSSEIQDSTITTYDIAAQTITSADVNPLGGIYSSKQSVYVVEVSSDVPAYTCSTLEPECNDANDLALFGYKWQGEVTVDREEVLNWSSVTDPAMFSVKFCNDGAVAESVRAGIVCIAVD